MAALILMVSGSLRDFVTAQGYWGAWGVWAVATLFATRTAGDFTTLPHPPVWVTTSYAVLGFGMLLSAAVNRDWVSAYQAVKIGVIALMFVAMWRLVPWLDWRRLIVAMIWAIVVAFIGLAMTKVWSPTSQILFWATREGSFLAEYGVLWRGGVFFLPIFLADAVRTPSAWARNSLMIAACIFLVLIDGSRTGLLLVMAIGMGFLVFLAWRGGWGMLRWQLRWMGAAAVLLLALQLLNTGVNLWLGGHGAGSGVVSAAQDRVNTVAVESKRVLEGALNRTFETRIGAGDPARVKLLRASLDQVGPCQPFGCGFKMTGTEIEGTKGLMPVHNAYLAALGDFGILGLTGMLGFLMAAVLPILRVLRQGDRSEQGLFVVAASGSALAYGMALMLNTFTTEMSEWGYLILMLAFAWAPAKGT
ncbi:hypothetical protein ACFO0J_01560 [Castellaniella hirudinis]|uniref:O-antigen ligase n=1 Tax=Castellaniella hirudinis TaxID=1144617 RepID=A0ABV8RTS1_9BURK